jgi:polygalacturonase
MLNVKDYGAKGDGVTADQGAFQTAMLAGIAAGKPVYVPAGTYRFTASLTLRDNACFVGAGVDATIIYGTQDFGFMMIGIDKTNVSISHMGFKGIRWDADVYGLFISGCNGVNLTDLLFENLEYGLKTGSGNVGIAYTVSDIRAVMCVTPMYLSHINGGTFTNLNLNAVSNAVLKAAGASANQYHGIYLERGCTNLTFDNLTITGGGGYCLQIYLSGGTSSGIVFNNTTLDARDGRYPLVIGNGYSDITFNGLSIPGMLDALGVAIIWYGPSNVVIDGITAVGGSNLHAARGTPSGCVIRNGTYKGPGIATIPGVTVSNVVRTP